MLTEASIVIPTFNGAERIHSLFQALLEQTSKRFEVVVVVDGSHDNTLEILKQYSEPSEVRILLQENMGRSVARNRGAAMARAEILIFYDDDMLPSPSSVSQHISFHKNFEGIVSGNAAEGPVVRDADIMRYKAQLSRTWTERFDSRPVMLGAQDAFFTAANCSVKRKHFEALGGFDETLCDAEDQDFALRAVTLGIPVYFDKSNEAVHYNELTFADYIRRQRQYRLAHKELEQRYPDRVRSYKSSLFRKFVYRLLAIPFLPRMLGLLNPFVLLPKRIRYRLYAAIIHALAVEYPGVPI